LKQKDHFLYGNLLLSGVPPLKVKSPLGFVRPACVVCPSRRSDRTCAVVAGDTWGTLTLFSGISYEKIVQETDPGNDPSCAPRAPNLRETDLPCMAETRVQEARSGSGTCVTLYPFSGISYEKIVQKKDYQKRWQC